MVGTGNGTRNQTQKLGDPVVHQRYGFACAAFRMRYRFDHRWCIIITLAYLMVQFSKRIYGADTVLRALIVKGHARTIDAYNGDSTHARQTVRNKRY